MSADTLRANAPVFIVGAPRSGSTLLYQLVTDCLDVGYVANAHASWPGGPALVEARRHLLAHRPARTDFSSTYGATEGDLGPSECGPYWYRFFPRRPHHAPAGSVDAATIAAIRASVAAFADAASRPVVYKNLFTTVRMGPLAEALPEARWIWISRDVADNAHSLLEGRLSNHGSIDEWFSVEPPGVEDLRALPPEQQVVEQVRRLDRLVATELASIGADRSLHVRYEDLCSRPLDELQRIRDFLARTGTPVGMRREPPTDFPMRTGEVRIDPALYERMAAHAQRTEQPRAMAETAAPVVDA